MRLLDENHPVDSLIVAGDIGYTGSKENCDKITRMFSDAFARHFFIDGNHDNYDALLKDGCQTEMLTYLSRGQIFQDGLGRDWLCIGGAESVDREIRQRRGFYWSPSEILTTEEASMIIKEVSDIDIYGVISHDCPSQFEIKILTTHLWRINWPFLRRWVEFNFWCNQGQSGAYFSGYSSGKSAGFLVIITCIRLVCANTVNGRLLPLLKREFKVLKNTFHCFWRICKHI